MKRMLHAITIYIYIYIYIYVCVCVCVCVSVCVLHEFKITANKQKFLDEKNASCYFNISGINQ